MEEMWLIDAGRLKRVLQRFEEHLTAFGLHERVDVVKTIIKGLKLQPKIDAVPVVRCKGCTRYNTKGCADGFGWCEGYDRGMMDNDFCSHGERKTDERKAD